MKLFLIMIIVFTGFVTVYGQETNEYGTSHQVLVTPNSYNKGCDLKETCYFPSQVFIELGDTVTWVNNDDALHTVTSGSPIDGSNEIFDSGLMKTGDSFSNTFDKDDKSYSYYCIIHPWMIGYVVVGEAQLQKIILQDKPEDPIIFDQDFKLDKFVANLSVPITMSFVGEDILILQKNDGKVLLVRNGELQNQPVLDFEVSNYGERGLLGITSAENQVYLFLTEANHDGGLSLGNRIYKFDWDGQKLTNPNIIKTLPGWTTSYNSGVMTSDSEGNVYAVSGSYYKYGALQNFPKSESYSCYTDKSFCDPSNKITIWKSIPKSLSCIKVSFQYYTTNPYGWQSEQPDMSNNPWEKNPAHILSNIQACINEFLFDNFSNGEWRDTSVVLEVNSDEYRAIGIRNSFGITVDPVTGNLWMTENGPEKFDEINLVTKKFNSGWAKTIGFIGKSNFTSAQGFEEYIYSDPEFSWELPVGITALSFANSNQFEKYKNWLFVGDTNNGNIYKFKLNTERTGFELETPHLSDLIVNIELESEDGSSHEQMDEILFGTNFGIISDIKFGSDGFMYIISLDRGMIYRITPS